LVLVGAAAWPLLQIATGTTVSTGGTWLAALDWWTFAVLFLLASDLLASRVEREWFLRVSTIGGAIMAVISIAQKYSSHGNIYWLFPSGYYDDVLGPFVNRNQFAAWMELLFPIALWLSATARRARSLYGIAAAILLSSVVASASRAGCALIVLEAIAVPILVSVRRRGGGASLARWAAGFAALTMAGILVMGYQGLLGRLTTAGSENLRVDGLRASIQMVRDRPWFGAGLGTWASMYPRYASFDAGVVMNQAHNDWVQWAAEGGLPFATLLFLFAALSWKSLFRSIYGVGVAAFLLHAFVDYPLQQRPALAGWFFAAAGAACAAGKAARASEHNDVLRGIRNLHGRDPRGDSARIQTPCASGSSRSLRG
jgi:O-antigen ligase